MIREGKVVAWYRGRMEYGPRALGNRSILADPSKPEMRDRVNAMVKKREAFRPFAPAVSIEEVHGWFDVPPMTALPYMIATVAVREQYRAMLPAITHVDGSARVQTVAANDNPAFHSLLKAVGRATGREIVLNTSFNVKGQPIVNTPHEAVETFLGTGIDCLFIENNLVSRVLELIDDHCLQSPGRSELTAADQIRLAEWNRTDVEFDTRKRVHDLFDEQALRTPEKTAVICRDQSLTYASLRERAERLARRLRKLGVGHETDRRNLDGALARHDGRAAGNL